MKYILRLLGLPFFMGLLIISFAFQVLYKSWLWMRWGGEANNYNELANRKTISEVFYKVKEQVDNQKELLEYQDYLYKKI